MDISKLITIDDEGISLQQAIRYLHGAGELPRFMQKILYQHVLQGEISQRGDSLKVDDQTIEKAIAQFLTQQKLTDPTAFDKWLQTQGINYDMFRQRIENSIALQKLKAELTSDQVKEYFEQNRELLDVVVLSRIVVEDRELADSIYGQVESFAKNFGDVAREHSVTQDKSFGGMMGALQVGQLPENTRDSVKGKQEGDLIGPLPVDGRFAILRVEKYTEAQLQGQLLVQLQERFFEQWIQAKLKDKQIKLNLE
ncbi:MAG: peptidylprolyl isomerase [Geitlerinemataceae cyanobacterium]